LSPFVLLSLHKYIDTKAGHFSHNFSDFLEIALNNGFEGRINAVGQYLINIPNKVKAFFEGLLLKGQTQKTIALWVISYYLLPSLIRHILVNDHFVIVIASAYQRSNPFENQEIASAKSASQ